MSNLIQGKTKTEQYVETLRDVRKRAKISPDLKCAIDETIQALEAGNKELAADLTAVKSFITGSMVSNPMENHFREDSDTNEKVLGNSVYGILGRIHRELALATQTLPSGMMILSAKGVEQRKLPERRTPTLKLIRQERSRIWRQVNRGRGK